MIVLEMECHAVLGGVFALSVLVLFSHFFELKISFDESLKESFLLAFFASLGLGFSIDFSKKSNFSKNFFIFLGLCAFIMVLQNLLGITIISLFDKQKELGLIAGSISLSGSFGMGAFWSEVLKTEPHNITNALDISKVVFKTQTMHLIMLSGAMATLQFKKAGALTTQELGSFC